MENRNRLAELEKCLLPYNGLWEDWLNSRLTELCEVETYIIDVQYKHKFKPLDIGLTMFFDNGETIELIIEKLKLDFVNFQDWTVRRFQLIITKLAFDSDWEDFYEVPIEDLNLPIILKKNLNYYKTKTISELFKRFTDSDLKQPDTFKNVVTFLLLLKQLKFESVLLIKKVA